MGYNPRLLISCPDKKGPISAISSFIAMHDGNILSADQYVSAGADSGIASSTAGGTFLMRLEIEGDGFGLARDEFTGAFAPLTRRHGMEWSVSYTDAQSAWRSWSPSTITASQASYGAGMQASWMPRYRS